jgi:putative ABC transport system permease protein
MAQRNVAKNWRHSLGSALSIAVGFVAIGLFEGYLTELGGSQSDTISRQSMLGDVIVERADASARAGREDPWGHQLGEPEQAFLEDFLARHAGEVETRVRFLIVSGLASTGKAGAVFVGFGHDVPEGARLRGAYAWNALAGKPLQVAGPESLMTARGLGAALDCVPEGPLPVAGPVGALPPVERPLRCRRARVQLTSTTAAGKLNVVTPEIAGVFEAGLKALDSRYLILPLALAQQLLDTHAVSSYSVLLAPGVDARQFAARLEAEARARSLPVVAMRWQDHRMGDTYRRAMELLGVYRSFVVLVVVTIAAMSVLMTMMKSVTERTREVGTLRSLGFLRRHVVALFTLEALLLALASSAIGAAITLALTFAINHAGISYGGGLLSGTMPLAVAVVPGAYAFSVAFLSSVAVLAALLPARQAARLGIPEALGHV